MLLGSIICPQDSSRLLLCPKSHMGAHIAPHPLHSRVTLREGKEKVKGHVLMCQHAARTVVVVHYISYDLDWQHRHCKALPYFPLSVTNMWHHDDVVLAYVNGNCVENVPVHNLDCRPCEYILKEYWICPHVLTMSQCTAYLWILILPCTEHSALSMHRDCNDPGPENGSLLFYWLFTRIGRFRCTQVYISLVMHRCY